MSGRRIDFGVVEWLPVMFFIFIDAWRSAWILARGPFIPRHSREGGNPFGLSKNDHRRVSTALWIPAFAGMTRKPSAGIIARLINDDVHVRRAHAHASTLRSSRHELPKSCI